MAEPTTRRTPLHSTHTNFFEQRNVAIIGVTYYFTQEQSTSPSCHAILAFIVPVLLNFLQLEYQNTELSPFETHPKSMGVALASLLLYCFAYDAKLRFSASHRWQTYALIAHRGMMFFGVLALVSMASILFPDSLGTVLYFLYILFSAGELLRHRLHVLWNWLYETVMGRLPLMLPYRLGAHAFSNTGAISRPRV